LKPGTFRRRLPTAPSLPPSNIPAYKWTRKNRTLAFLQGTGDARGFNQWKEVGRYVKKRAKSIYILGPIIRKSKNVQVETDTYGNKIVVDDTECVGFFGIPVFRMEDTDGDPLEYSPLDTGSLPLADVAKKWGLDVISGSFNGEYYGYYSPDKKEIVMVSAPKYSFPKTPKKDFP
jgi:hypothetical protein